MARPLGGVRGPLAAAGVFLAVLVAASLLYAGKAVVLGPDADDILTPLFFDASRDIGCYGLFAGMYNPGILGGLAHWNSPNFHVLYPLYFNWLGSDATVFDTYARLKAVAILHLAIYGAGCFLLARLLGTRAWIAVATGIAMPFLPAVQSLLTWTAILASFAWLPWVFYFQGRIHAGQRAPAAAVGLAASALMLLYAQPAQNLVVAVVGSALLFAALGAIRMRALGWRGALRSLLPAAGWCLLAGIVVLLCSGAYLRGVVQAVSESIRWLGDGGHIVGKEPIPVRAFAQHALGARALFAPFVYAESNTVVIGNLYLGALPVAAALAYVLARGRDAMTVAFLVVASVLAALCFVWLAPVVAHLPAVKMVREVNWWSCLVVTLAFPAAVRAAQALLTGEVRASHRRTIVALVLVAVLAGIGFAVTSAPGPKASQGVMAAATAVLFALALWWNANRRPGSAPPTSLVVSTIIVLVVSVPLAAIWRSPLGASSLFTPERMVSRAAAADFASKYPDSTTSFRVGVSPDFAQFRVLTHDLSNAGVRAIRGDIHPQSYAKFQILYFPNRAVARLFGVKYMLTPDAASTPAEGVAAYVASMRVDVDEDALPRMFLVDSGVSSVPSSIAAVVAMTEDSPLAAYVSEREAARKRISLDGIPAGPFEWREIRPLQQDAVRIDALVTTRSKALLVLNEDPGARWQAVVGGQSLTAVRVNGFQTGFVIPSAGTYAVSIRRRSTLLALLVDDPGEGR